MYFLVISISFLIYQDALFGHLTTLLQSLGYTFQSSDCPSSVTGIHFSVIRLPFLRHWDTLFSHLTTPSQSLEYPFWLFKYTFWEGPVAGDR